jgi:hypothetical protein
LNLAATRAASQRFHRPAAIKHPVDVLREAGPVQAQEPRAARLAFRARARGLTAADVDSARTEERSLLRIWCMRKTIHLIATEDAGWLVPLFAPMIVRWSRRRLEQLGVDRREQDRALDLIHKAVDREGALTRPQLAERLQSAGLDGAAEFKVHLWLLATLDGELILGPDRGGQTCLVRTADWVGPLQRRPREECLEELARLYLRGYAPADERDLARWSGLPLRDARAGFERIARELVGVGDLFALGKPPRKPRGPAVRMLGAFDNYNLGYVDRAFALPSEHEKRVNPGGGIIRPAIIVDGRFVATWSSKRAGNRLTVEIEPFEPLPPETEKSIDAEVADLGRFEAVAATIPRR